MKRIEFSVDADLRVTTCTEFFWEGEVRRAAEMDGRLYHEVIPRIVFGDRDAVAGVIASGAPLHLENYRFCCIYDSIVSEVYIDPLCDEAGCTCGASVSIDFPCGCSYVNRLRHSQSLIDIGKSASMLAHGVRNPLNAIKGAVVYLKSRYGGDPTFLEFSGVIEQEIGNLDRFITSFLSSSYETLERLKTDLNELLCKAESVTALQTASSGVKVDFTLEGVLPVEVNPFQIDQAVMNVLNNALQAMPGGGAISVRSTREGRFARVEIADNGPGMPEGFVEEPDTPAAEGSRKGRGFGLFIAREVLQSHGGSLEIRSEHGRGTRVVLLIPVTGDE